MGVKTFCVNNDITATVQIDEEICKLIIDTIDTYKKLHVLWYKNYGTKINLKVSKKWKLNR